MAHPVRKFLAYPGTGGLDLDDPAMTVVRRDILRQNRFLRKVYQSWYQEIWRELPNIPGRVLELGSGAGFFKEYVPDLITSEILEIQGVDLVANALALPCRERSLRAIVMTNVLHHIPRVACFFREADRCLADGGKVILVEPWITDWSRFIYARLHHEPMDPGAPGWDFASHGPVSGANEALPWIVFSRDRVRFEREFSNLEITRIQPIMPFLYLLSGGFTSRFAFPEQTFGLWVQTEKLLERWRNRLALFAVIILTKVSPTNMPQ